MTSGERYKFAIYSIKLFVYLLALPMKMFDKIKPFEFWKQFIYILKVRLKVVNVYHHLNALFIIALAIMIV